jgi:hypothetical protein
MRFPKLTPKSLIILGLLVSTPAYADCLTPDQTRITVPNVEHTAFDDIQDLSGPAYLSFVRNFIEGDADLPPANEAMVFYRTQKGHGADIRVVWFQDGCAVSKATYPAQFWILFMLKGHGA